MEYKIRGQKVAYFGHVAKRQSLEHTVMLGMGGGGDGKEEEGESIPSIGYPIYPLRWIDGIAEDTA